MLVIQEERVITQKELQAKAFVYWAKRYRKDVLRMSYEAFGNYLTSFIQYLLRNYADLLTEKDLMECEERLAGKLTEMVRGFEIEERYSERSMNKTWRKLFILFCMTGDIKSHFDIFKYLNTGDTRLLPDNVWERKEVFGKQRQGARGDTDLRKRVEALELQLAAFAGGGKVEVSETNISAILSQYIREQMSDRGVERSAILNSLINAMNEEGANFVRMELELILDRVDNFLIAGRIRAIFKRISQLEILLNEDGKPYTLSELLAMPLGFDLIQEDQKLPRSQ